MATPQGFSESCGRSYAGSSPAPALAGRKEYRLNPDTVRTELPDPGRSASAFDQADLTPDAISRAMDRVLPFVQKPVRYTGGEWNSVLKPWDEIPYRLALVFPDVYELGMSNLGMMVLLSLIHISEPTRLGM